MGDIFEGPQAWAHRPAESIRTPILPFCDAATLAAIAGFVRSKVVARLAERARRSRERRQLLAMGPHARLELTAMLIAQGHSGLDHGMLHAGRERDLEQLWGHAGSAGAPHVDGQYRSGRP